MKPEKIEKIEAEFSIQDLLKEIKENALRERISSIVQYRDLIDEIVEEKRIYGYFSDDEDTTQVKKDLELLWPEVRNVLDK